MEKEFKFDWSDFTTQHFKNMMKEREFIWYDVSEYLGCVRIGDLCFDFVERWIPEEKPKKHIFFDLYIGGVDSGYGYSYYEPLVLGRYANKYEVPDEEAYPYDEYEKNGETDQCFSEEVYKLSYEEFVDYVEKVLTNFLDKTESRIQGKAKEPLHIW